MRFATYDFDRSAYANSKSQIKNNLTFATGKAWVWKKYLPAEDMTLGDTNPIAWSMEKYMKTADVKQAFYPGSEWAYDTDVTDIATFDTIQQYDVSGLTGIDYPDKFLSSTSMIDFIRANKINEDISGIKNVDDTWMTLSEARAEIQSIRNEIELDGTSYLTFSYLVQRPIYITNKNKKKNHITYYRNNKLDVFESDIDKSIINYPSLSGYASLLTDDSYEIINSLLMKPIGSTLKRWTEKFVIPEEEDERNLFVALEHISNKIVTYLNTTRFGTELEVFSYEYTPRLVKIPHNVFMSIIDDILFEYDELINADKDILWNAKDYPLGQILDKFNALEDVLGLDINNVNEVYLSFRLSVSKDTNSLEDEQDKTRLAIIEDLNANIPEWKEYCFIKYEAVYDESGESSVFSHYREYLYILDWSKIEKLNNYKFMVLLQAFMTLDVGSPNKKYSIGDYAKLAAMVVVAFVLAPVTGGASLIVTGQLVAYMTLVGAIIMAIGMYTGNDQLIKLGQAIMIVVSITSITSGMATSEFGLSETLQYTLTISNMALGEYRKLQAKKWQQDFNQLSEEIEEVSELVTPFDKMKKIERFIHGDDLKSPKEISYDDLWVTPYDLYYKL